MAQSFKKMKTRRWCLFGDVQIAEPYHLVEHYGKLAKEKEVVGIYIRTSIR
jgi:hypothetical protein